MSLGINCGRKLKRIRSRDLNLKKVPFKNIHHERKVLVVGLYQSDAKQPCSGKRNYVKFNIGKTKNLAFIKGDGIKKLVKIHDTVTIQSLAGAKGRSMGDLSSCRYVITKINGVPVKELFLRKKLL